MVGTRTRLSVPMPENQMARSIEECASGGNKRGSAAGEVCHSMHCAPDEAISCSAMTEAGAAFAGKMGKEARGLPMCHGGRDEALEIGEQALHRLTLFRRMRRQTGGDRSGLEAGADGALEHTLAVGNAPFCGPYGPFAPVLNFGGPSVGTSGGGLFPIDRQGDKLRPALSAPLRQICYGHPADDIDKRHEKDRSQHEPRQASP
jgi:hypothetical protein